MDFKSHRPTVSVDGTAEQRWAEQARMWQSFADGSVFTVNLTAELQVFEPGNDIHIVAQPQPGSDAVSRSLAEVCAAHQVGQIEASIWEPLMDQVRQTLLERLGAEGLHRLAQFFLMVSLSKQLLID